MADRGRRFKMRGIRPDSGRQGASVCSGDMAIRWPNRTLWPLRRPRRRPRCRLTSRPRCGSCNRGGCVVGDSRGSNPCRDNPPGCIGPRRGLFGCHRPIVPRLSARTLCHSFEIVHLLRGACRWAEGYVSKHEAERPLGCRRHACSQIVSITNCERPSAGRPGVYTSLHPDAIEVRATTRGGRVRLGVQGGA